MYYGRVYQLPYLPLSFFSHLMVHLLHLREITPLLFWRNGIIVSNGAQIARVEFNTQSLECSVLVRVPKRRTSASKDVSKESHISVSEAGASRHLLLRQIVDTVDSSLEMAYSGQASITRLVPCSHCLALNDPHVFQFTFRECIQALSSSKPYLFCRHIESRTRRVRIHDLCPDIAFADLPVIASRDLKYEKKIGEGGFGTVYRGTLRDEVVAIKQLRMSGEIGDLFAEFQQEAYIMRCVLALHRW